MFRPRRFRQAHTEAFVGYDEGRARRFWAIVSRLLDRWHVEVSGLERLPAGRALLYMNHAFGWDAALPIAAIRRATGRRVWVLGEHLWWKVPYLRGLAAAVGTVDGTPANADALLAAGELVLVLPGGLREAVKPRELRYRLIWDGRYGFVRVAIHNQAPLVPVAGIGADEWVDLVGNPFARGRRWLGRDFPLVRPRWGIPIVRRRGLQYVIGAPVYPHLLPGESAQAAAVRVRREARGALEELIDEALAARVGFRD
ncbi:MAG: acyltransferase family protein [Polyangiaceae bacterium]|nr:acyltransferase family protein [Polyangiaceae bacterium]